MKEPNWLRKCCSKALRLGTRSGQCTSQTNGSEQRPNKIITEILHRIFRCHYDMTACYIKNRMLARELLSDITPSWHSRKKKPRDESSDSFRIDYYVHLPKKRRRKLA